MSIKTYSDLIKLKTFEERFNYLKLNGQVGCDTFGYDRYLNQNFYKKDEDWLRVRDEVIARDFGCDLGMEGHEIQKNIIVHHMNPITKDDIINRTEFLLNPEYLICVTHNTHMAIHYGNEDSLVKGVIIRKKNDTCPWRINKEAV